MEKFQFCKKIGGMCGWFLVFGFWLRVADIC